MRRSSLIVIVLDNTGVKNGNALESLSQIVVLRAKPIGLKCGVMLPLHSSELFLVEGVDFVVCIYSF